jgi:hypothetical protein
MGQRARERLVHTRAGVQCKFLLAMGGIIRVIKVEYDGSGRLCVAGNELVHSGCGETIDVLAVHTVFEP